MNKSLNILKQITANSLIKGEITVKNEGNFIACYEINYLIGDVHLSQISNKIKKGQAQSIAIPGLANEVQIKVKELITEFPEIWKTIFTIKYPYAGHRNFRLWGKRLDVKYGIVNTLEPSKSKKQNYETKSIKV